MIHLNRVKCHASLTFCWKKKTFWELSNLKYIVLKNLKSVNTKPVFVCPCIYIRFDIVHFIRVSFRRSVAGRGAVFTSFWWIFYIKVDGDWATWSTWSQCDVTCENGTQSRKRTCTNPAPADGGLDCIGDGVEIKICLKHFCPSIFV
jgi:hypothetical protein